MDAEKVRTLSKARDLIRELSDRVSELESTTGVGATPDIEKLQTLALHTLPPNTQIEHGAGGFVAKPNLPPGDGQQYRLFRKAVERFTEAWPVEPKETPADALLALGELWAHWPDTEALETDTTGLVLWGGLYRITEELRTIEAWLEVVDNPDRVEGREQPQLKRHALECLGTARYSLAVWLREHEARYKLHKTDAAGVGE